jgi:hypothetical protein
MLFSCKISFISLVSIVFKYFIFFYQMSAVLLLILTSESAPSVARLSQAEWESYHELDHQVRI